MRIRKYHKRPPLRRVLLIALCLLLAAGVGVGATLAYFAENSGSVVNTFTAGSVGAQVLENKNDSAKQSIKVKNTGSAPVFVRVRLVTFYENGEGQVDASLGAPALEVNLNSGWEKLGEYYYCTEPVAANKSTPNLLAAELPMAKGQVIEVLADTVQAAPAAAVKEVWGQAAHSLLYG